MAQVLAEDGGADVELIGRHASKMGLVTGLHAMHLGTDDAAMAELQGVFDVCVEASGSSQGIRLASKAGDGGPLCCCDSHLFYDLLQFIGCCSCGRVLAGTPMSMCAHAPAAFYGRHHAVVTVCDRL